MDDSKIEKEPTPYEALSEKVSYYQKRYRKAIWRGIFFLILSIGLSYYAKSKRSTFEVVSVHGLAGWVFVNQNQYSVLLVGPDDNNDSNLASQGDRFFFNPLPLSFLEENFIRYKHKNLYLAGSFLPSTLQDFCKAQSQDFKIYKATSWSLTPSDTGPILKNCESKVQTLTLHDPGLLRINTDWNLPVHVSLLDSVQTLLFDNSGNRIIITNSPLLPLGADSSQIYICTRIPDPQAPLPKAQVFLYPGQGKLSGSDSTALVPSKTQALGLVWEKDGRLLLKRLQLKTPLP